jgi:hypothetical protein
MKSPEGQYAPPRVGDEEFEGFVVGDTISVEWGPYQRRLGEG